MRIRGYDEETEELSEDLKNISGDIADLTKTANNSQGISLFTDDTKQTYKSTYQLLKDISEIWDELTDKQQAGLLEKLGGKRGGQAIAGMLEDFSQVEKALDTMENAAGSADAEMGIIEDSISYKLNALRETWVDTLKELISRDDFKELIDNLIKLSEAITTVIKSLGTKGTLGVLFGLFAGGNLIKGLKTGESAALSLLEALMGLKDIPDMLSGVKIFLSTLFSDWEGLKALKEPEKVTEKLSGANAALEASNIRVAESEQAKVVAQEESIITSGEEIIATNAETESEEKNVLANQSDAYSEMMEVQAELASAASSSTEAGETMIETSTEIANASANFSKATSKFSSATAEMVTSFAYGASQGEGLTAVLGGLKAALGTTLGSVLAFGTGLVITGIAIAGFIKWMNKSRDAAKSLNKSLSEVGDINSNIDEYSKKLEDLDKQIEEHKELLKEKNDLIGTQQLKDLETEKSITESQLKLEQAKLEVLKEEAKYKTLDYLEQDDNWERSYITEGIITLGNAKASRTGNWDDAKVGQKYNYDTNDRIAQLSAEYELYSDINEEIAAQYKVLEDLSGKDDRISKQRRKAAEDQIKNLKDQRSSIFQTFSEGYNAIALNIESLKSLYGENLPEELKADIDAFNKLADRITYSTNKQNENTDAVKRTTQSIEELRKELYSSGTWDDIKIKLGVDLESDEFKQSVENWKEQNADLIMDNLQNEVDKINDWGLSDYYEGITSGTIQSKFGNVDMDKRAIITWSDELKKTYKKELESWDYDPEIGSIDTVFGGSGSYNINGTEHEIAFTPILQTENGSQFLSADTVDTYINQVLSKASEDGNVTLEEILKIDAEGTGLKVGDEFVKGIIAAVDGLNDSGNISAIDVGSLLHFVGDYGAYNLALEDYNKSLEQFEKTAENAVAASKAFDAGFDDLNSNLEAYKDTLDKANEEGYEFVKTSSDYADTVSKLAADISGLTGYEFSNDQILEFLNQDNNFDILTEAINGSEEALRQLQKTAMQYSNLQVDVEAILDTDKFDFDYQAFLEWFNSDEVQNAGQLTFTAGLDSSGFIEQLNQALQNGKATANQIKNLFNNLGWDVDFEYEDKEIFRQENDRGFSSSVGRVETIKVPKTIRYISKDKSTISANTPQGFNSSQKDKINSKSGSGGGGGSDKEETPEIFDWIETRISRLERDIQNFDKVVNASYKNWGERLGAIPKEYDKVLQEIETQNAGYARYMQEASKVGLPEEYAQKVREGMIDIESITDETLKQGINDYKQWYEKAIQCADAVEDLRAKLAELAKLKFDNIASIFDSVLESVTHLNDLINTVMDTVETQGYLVSKAYYQKMTEYESYNLSKLEQEYEELKKARQEALDSGAIEENSQDWWDMQHSIEGVESAIYDAKKALAEYADAMRQIEWDLFDRTQGYISQITDESDWIQALLRTEHIITNDETGRLNEYGKSIGGLVAVDYNVYMRQSQMYADEIEKINKELANDPYNTKLIDRRNELLNLQRQSIQAAEDEKEAIRSLIKESYDEMLRILQELIDKRKEALQAEKDLYDYQKNIQSQADNINSLRKQIMALSGDESEENQARLQSLRTDLKNAESDLEDTEYDKWLSDQNEAMDNMYQSAEDFLNERLKNIDLLVSEVIATTNESAELISDTINTEVTEVGYNLTSEMESIWDGQQRIVSDFHGTFVDSVGQIIDTQYVSTVAVCDSIAAYTVAMMNNSTAIANGILNNINQNSSQIFNNINATINAINQGTSSITSYLNSILSVCNNIAAKVGTGGGGSGSSNAGSSGSPNTGGGSSEYHEVPEKFTPIKNGTTSNPLANPKSVRTKGSLGRYTYAEGGRIGVREMINISGEDGFILAKTGEEVLSLEKIAAMKDVLQAFEPLALAVTKMPSIASVHNTASGNNEFNISFEFPNVYNYEDFIQTARTDSRFERIVQQMTIGNALGGNTLKKYSL